MIVFENVQKKYENHEVLKGINLTVEDGQLAVLIGPSGCGKTTSLQLINRLIDPSGGRILIDGKDIQAVDPVKLRRSIGYVIQEIGLFPHMTIEQNIEIVPKMLGWKADKCHARTMELLRLVDMDPALYLDRYPADLSGGQQQRIGLLRALAAEPPIILMDEPFGALDPITRESLQDEIRKLQRKLNKTIVFVTHDMDEAVKIADTIILMRDGEIVQQASPEELLSNPANEFVEQFIGRHRLYNGNSLDTVEDVMRRELAVITPEKGMSESIALMQRKSVNTVIVVDEDNRYLGFVPIDRILDEGREGMRIGELADKSAPTVKPGTRAQDAFGLLFKEHMDLVAVVDEEEKLIGVVTKTSMVRSLAHVVWKGDRRG